MIITVRNMVWINSWCSHLPTAISRFIGDHLVDPLPWEWIDKEQGTFRIAHVDKVYQAKLHDDGVIILRHDIERAI